MPKSLLNKRWIDSAYGQSFLHLERQHTARAIRQIAGPRVLLVGQAFDEGQLQELDFPMLARVHHSFSTIPHDLDYGSNLLADPAFLPFAEGDFSSVVLPHTLECHELPHQVLREAHRVLQSDGHLVLTGFNPYSWMGVQRYLYPRAAYRGHYYSLRRVKDWMQLLGFEVVSSAMYQYAPLCKNERLRKSVGVVNAIGDRWLPLLGGSYIIGARKREPGMRMVGKLRFARPERNGITAPAHARKTGHKAN